MSRRPGPATDSANFRLDAGEIVKTVAALQTRISGRFPESGLGRLAADIANVARVASERVEYVTRPHLPLRIGVAIAIALLVSLVAGVFLSIASNVTADFNVDAAGDLIQTIEAAVSEMVFAGAAIFFLATLEQRMKRRRALGFLRELRALAHIIDMHQLTKDPDRIMHPSESDEPPEYSPFDLSRYLDHCSELLSLLSKIAALYIQNFDDPVVLAAVDEVETLATGLSGKIWQKIMILERIA